MLPKLSETSSRVSRVGRTLLVLLALTALAAPVIYVSRTRPAQAGDGGEVGLGAEPAGDAEFLPPLCESERKITAELEKPTSIQFNETPLPDMIDYLKDLHAIEIHLDHKALDDAGIDSEVRITCHPKGVSLRSALRRMLSNLDMTFIIHDEMLLLTTTELASNTLVTRTYPVGDLADGDKSKADDYGDLEEAITSTVMPLSWKEGGGVGKISLVKKSQSFVISQTQANHDEILKLLRALRAARKAGSGPKSSQWRVRPGATFAFFIGDSR